MKIIKTMNDDGLFHFYLTIINKEEFTIKLEYENYHPEPFFLQKDQRIFCILGNPIIGNKIDKHLTVEKLLEFERNNDLNILQKINGEFTIFIIDNQNRKVQIINDRFASIPIYYFSTAEKHIFSVSYNDLWVKENLATVIEPYNVFEFMWFHKLLGNKTLDKISKFLTPASVFSIVGNSSSIINYWKPSFQKSNNSVKEFAYLLAGAIKNSIILKTSDNPRAGLFLSGGIDSRTMLSAFEQPPVCFTIAVTRNIEFQVAKKIAKIKRANHHYLHLPDNKYSLILDKSVKLGGGMYAYDHAIFLDYKDEVTPYADVAFHGHGFDYMFQGMYVPVTYYHLFGKRTHIPKYKPIMTDPVKFFINNIPFRLKHVNLLDYLLLKNKDDYYEMLYSSATDVITESGIEFQSKYDIYEYLITHALSRHYSNSNITSLMTYIEQRTLTFENRLFDLFHQIPPQLKIGGKLARETLKILNKDLGNVISANTRYRAVSSPIEKTFIWVWDYLWRKSRKAMKNEILVNENERTWPLRDDAFQYEKNLQVAAIKAASSHMLEELDIFNMVKIKTDVDNWLNPENKKLNSEQNTLGGAFMTTIITVNEFLSQDF
ncbi:MAG: hypothetical protein IH852_09400 [Bacteroidetes bacterium]|nr:hypothetical protein [Bacteroidota bacterium]